MSVIGTNLSDWSELDKNNFDDEQQENEEGLKEGTKAEDRDKRKKKTNIGVGEGVCFGVFGSEGVTK
eukprot:CAMPEP_0182469674 /NCGR_PEP_ID=MMETSP1319-20130603/17458_1 /TAXON_ID=172717 /ORGANISM="Bolidomonas pacifica, Strain RCC208" /LENGTH=66 /DNA_ID=CAMNT_0024670001 /DNA_START=532 /DNA_END=732 /DNA_ORIENTATION=-